MSTPWIGEIRMFAGNFPPAGWAFCDGSLIAITDNETLFNLIGTSFGGDGQSTFALPDLRGRVPVHQGNGFIFAETGGVESVTLTTSQIPAHSHQAMGSSTATSADPTGTVPAQWSDGEYSTATATGTVAPNAIGAAGGSQPHDNMSPFLVVNFIIALFGIFPTQN